MSIGIKLRRLRKMRGYTQKQLGLLVGFSEETADVRITQYETGTRVPKDDMIRKMAEILKVNPDYLMAPAPIDPEEIMRTLFFLDENNNINLSSQEVIMEDGTEEIRISLTIKGMDYFLKQWYEKQKELKKGLIIQDEYYEWKTNWKVDKNDLKKYEQVLTEYANLERYNENNALLQEFIRGRLDDVGIRKLKKAAGEDKKLAVELLRYIHKD